MFALLVTNELGKDAEGNDRGLFGEYIPSFPGDTEKPQEKLASRSIFEHEVSRIRSRSASPRQAVKFGSKNIRINTPLQYRPLPLSV
jgi:hypothetical protein